MAVNESDAAGAQVSADFDELRDGARKLHGLAEETKDKLASSDRALESTKPALRGLRSAAAFAAYADFETARGESATSAFAQAGENVAHAAERYEHTDSTNAAAINRSIWR